MPCPRCRGLMVPEQFLNLSREGGYGSFNGWRCLCCGNILDTVIVKNRLAVTLKTCAFPAAQQGTDALGRGAAGRCDTECGMAPIVVL